MIKHNRDWFSITLLQLSLLFGLLGLITGFANAEMSVTPDNVKAYLLRQNTWEKCTYPEYWYATSEQRDEMMEKSSLSTDAEERWLFYSHYKGSMRLTEEFFPDVDQEQLWTTTDGFDGIITLIKGLSEEDRKATLDCDSDWAKIAKPVFK